MSIAKFSGSLWRERYKILAVQIATGKAACSCCFAARHSSSARGVEFFFEGGFKGGKLEHSYALLIVFGCCGFVQQCFLMKGFPLKAHSISVVIFEAM